MLNHKGLGARAETLAESFLVQKGWQKIDRNMIINWGRGRGEVDLLMEDPTGIIVLVEVKSASKAWVEGPEVRIDWKKQRKLAALAQQISLQYPDRNIRIDAVSLYWNQQREPQFRHIPNIVQVD